MNTPTDRRPSKCRHYEFHRNSLWMHRCAYNGLPCKLLAIKHCPDFAPKPEKKD